MATEKEMLGALLEDDRLGDEERESFQDMLGKIDRMPNGRLYPKQRSWVEKRYEELDLGAGESLNLHSSGKVPSGLTPGRPGIKMPWEAPGYVKPTKPPGRS